jgi:hypothetical protein
MQFEKDQNGNPHGRPPGSRNKRTIAGEKLFDPDALVQRGMLKKRCGAFL